MATEEVRRPALEQKVLLPFKGPDTILEVRDLRVRFVTDFGVVKAVDGVSFTADAGKTLAIVGESGSGKSVSALSIMGLLPPGGEVVSGEALFGGQDLISLGDDEMRKIRGNRIAMVFQDPLTSLNPVFNVGRQIAEAVREHAGSSRSDAKKRAIELLELVGIPRAIDRAGDFPHQFSGGMRQRVMLAMAIAMSPAVLIADEPTTALDVTVQAQILDLLKSLQEEFRMAIILITHDLGMVAEQADQIAVMYAGHIAEYGRIDDVYYGPQHPYTIGLMNSLARLDARREGRLQPIRGHPPSLILVPSGCPFHPRCDYMRDVCQKEYPALTPRTADPRHLAACHFAGDLPEPSRPPMTRSGQA